MGAVMNEINMVDGISGAANPTPRAGVEGAGAAQIYSPQPHDISFLIQTLSPAETQSHWNHQTPSLSQRKKETASQLEMNFVYNMSMHESYYEY